MSSWRRVWQPRDRRPIYEWAHEKVFLPPAYSKTGSFSIRDSSHFKGPLLCLQSVFVHQVNVMAPVRSGKSLIADIYIPWTVDNDPGPILTVFHKDDVAKDHAKTRVQPILKGSDKLSHLLSNDRFDTSTQTVLFRNGVSMFYRGSAISNLQAKGIRYLIMDEPWLYKQGTIGQAKGRTDDFKKTNSQKVLVISQGSDDPLSDWNEEFDRGALQEWLVPCPGCGKDYPLVFDGFRSDKSRYGLRFDYDKIHGRRKIKPNTVRYECRCGYDNTKEIETKNRWNKDGYYYLQSIFENEIVNQIQPVEQPPKEISFHWNNVLDLPWEHMANIFLEARDAQDSGNDQPMIDFVTKRKAEKYDPNKAFSYVDIPRQEITGTDDKAWIDQDFIFMTVDVQKDHFWYLVEAWNKDARSAVLQADIAYTYDELEEYQQKFKIPNACVAVDLGFNRTEVGYQCAMRGWNAMRGDGRESFIRKDSKGNRIHLPYSPPQFMNPLLGLRVGDPRFKKLKAAGGNLRCRWLYWSNSYFKDIMEGRRTKMERQQLIMVPPDIGDHYLAQLYSERKVQLPNGKWQWQQIPNMDNHLWDCACMQVVFATLPQVGIIQTQDIR